MHHGPSPSQLLVTKARLANAEVAYDQLMNGTAVSVFVDQNGERLQYTTANSAKLLGYIQSLRAELCGGGFSSPHALAPLRFLF